MNIVGKIFRDIALIAGVGAAIGLGYWVAFGGGSELSVGSISFVSKAEQKKYIEEDKKNIEAEDFGNLTELQNDYINTLKNTQSDIDGMTMYDKYEQGLSPEDGSDTDQDGLTDKEEIEEYGSDPLKASTAGDLYTDKYKVDNGIDVNTKCDYEGTPSYPNNHDEDVILEADEPLSLNATCNDLQDYFEIEGADIVKELTLYDFSGHLSVTISDKAKETYGITNLSECHAYVAEWGHTIMNSTPIEVDEENSRIRLSDYVFDRNKIYAVVITDRVATNAIFRSDKLPHAKALDNSGDAETDKQYALVMTNTMEYFFDDGVDVYYVADNDGDINEDMLKNIMKWIDNAYGWQVADNAEFHTISKADYIKKYTALRTFWPGGYNDEAFGAHDDLVEENLASLFLMYIDYDAICNDYGLVNGTDTQYSFESPQKTETAFDPSTDAFPFGNFATPVAQGGVCAGISLFTVQNFNQENLQLSGGHFVEYPIYVKTEGGTMYGKPKVIAMDYDVTPYDCADALSSKGLSDFRDSTYVTSHSEKLPCYKYHYDSNGVAHANSDGLYEIDEVYTDQMTNLDEEDEQFVNLITVKWQELNAVYEQQLKKHIYPKVKASGENDFRLVQNGRYFSWRIIDQMLEELKQGKIMELSLTGLKDGKSVIGHSVVVYGAKQDPNNEDIYYFYIYDCNYPDGNLMPGFKANNVMTVLRMRSSIDGDDGFSYYYAPYDTEEVSEEFRDDVVYSNYLNEYQTYAEFAAHDAYMHTFDVDHEVTNSDTVIDSSDVQD